MNFSPTPVRCSGCGKRDVVSTRMVNGTRVVELPLNWKRVGMGRFSRGVLLCGACYQEETKKS